MILHRLPLASILAAAVGAACPGHADPRIATHFYQPSEIVTIHGRTDTQSTITFAADEQIQNVAVGDSATWQVTPNKRADLLFVKPMKGGARTNMTVVTDQRTYLFDLVATPREAALYMLRFTYPAAPKPAPVVTAATAAPAVAPMPAPATPDPATLNFAWIGRGDKALLPLRSFDDGKSIWLSWPKDVQLPAILTTEAQGVEGPVNYTVHGEYIVVEGLPSQIILRSGKQMATLTSGTAPPAADQNRHPKRRIAANSKVRPGPPYATFASN